MLAANCQDLRALSLQLELKMAESGFSRSTVVFHLALVSVYEKEFLKTKPDGDVDRIVCGSYGEGWAYSRQCLDGRVAPDSDVDVTRKEYQCFFEESATRQDERTLPDGPGHFKDCACQPKPDVEDLIIEESGEGHCILAAVPKPLRKPVNRYKLTATFPTIDFCHALPCHCIPRNCTLFSPQRTISLLPAEVLRKCRSVGVHLVNAQRPGFEDKEHRISYSFMERELVREFPDTFGRVLVFLKYIFKVNLKGLGLKSYISKTLVLHVLEESSKAELELGNVLNLTKKALQLLKDNLSSYSLGRKEACLPHFFQDAPVFFRQHVEDVSTDVRIARVSREIEGIEETAKTFMAQLKPLSSCYFSQPYVLFPYCNVIPDLNDVFSKFESSDFPTALESLPVTFETVKVVLKVLWMLKNEDWLEAKEILESTIDISPQYLQMKAKEDVEELEDYIRTFFNTQNSVWMVSVVSNTPPSNGDAPQCPCPSHAPSKPHAYIFPDAVPVSKLQNFLKFTVVNFSAVLNHLRFTWTPEIFSEATWRRLIESQPFPDFQDFYMFAGSCRELDNLRWAVEELKKLPRHSSEDELVQEVQTRLSKFCL